VTEAVVARALVGISQHRICLRRFLELFLGIFITLIAVGVIFERELSIGALDIGLGRASRDPKHFVKVALAHDVTLATRTMAGRSRRSPSMYPCWSTCTTSPSRAPVTSS